MVASAALSGSRTQGVMSGHRTFSRRSPAPHLSAGSRMARPWHPAAGLLVCILPAPGFSHGWVGDVDRKWKEQLSSPMSAARMLRHPGTSRMAREIGTGARGQRCPCRDRWHCWWKVRAVCIRDRLVTGKSTLPAQLREGGFLGDHPSTESRCGWEPSLPWGPLLSPGQPPPRTLVTSLPLLLTPAWPPRHPQGFRPRRPCSSAPLS